MGPKIPPKRNEFLYNTSHPSQGIAVVLNYTHNRSGCEKDEKAICDVLEKLQFNVEIWRDLSEEELRASLKRVSKMDHTDSNCFVMVVMAHGDKDSIVVGNDDFELVKLWKPFVGNNCPTLIGKPKMFFIQSCRGDKKDIEGVETDAAPPPVKPVNIRIPMYADLLVMYASYFNHVAYRNTEKGSWFIQAMCDVLSEDIRETELLSLLTRVSYRVAYDFSNPVDAECPGKQIPAITSMLTKQFYFVDTKGASAAPPIDQRKEDDAQRGTGDKSY